MACKRSAVRARLAPQVRSEIRTFRTGSTAGKYSNGGRVGRRTYVRIGHLPPAGAAGRAADSRRLAGSGQPVTWANPRLIGPVTLAIWSPPGPHGGPLLPVTVAAFASGPAALAVLAVRSTPRSPRLLARAARSLTGARRAGPARRAMVSVRRWARWCAAPLRRRVAPWRSPRACRRAGAPREELGRAPAARPRTQGFDAADAKSSPPSMAG